MTFRGGLLAEAIISSCASPVAVGWGAGGSQRASSLSEAVSWRKRLSGAALSLYGSASAISWASSAMGSRSRSDRNLLLAIGVLGFCFAPRALTHTRSINTRRTNFNYQSWWLMNPKYRSQKFILRPSGQSRKCRGLVKQRSSRWPSWHSTVAPPSTSGATPAEAVLADVSECCSDSQTFPVVLRLQAKSPT